MTLPDPTPDIPLDPEGPSQRDDGEVTWGVVDEQGFHKCVGGRVDAESLAAIGHAAGRRVKVAALYAPPTSEPEGETT